MVLFLVAVSNIQPGYPGTLIINYYKLFDLRIITKIMKIHSRKRSCMKLPLSSYYPQPTCPCPG
jgi:hypothetical protein